MSDEKVPEMMMQLTIYSDGTLTIDGRARQDAVPFILRQIADSIEAGGTILTDMGLN